MQSNKKPVVVEKTKATKKLMIALKKPQIAVGALGNEAKLLRKSTDINKLKAAAGMKLPVLKKKANLAAAGIVSPRARKP